MLRRISFFGLLLFGVLACLGPVIGGHQFRRVVMVGVELAEAPPQVQVEVRAAPAASCDQPQAATCNQAVYRAAECDTARSVLYNLFVGDCAAAVGFDDDDADDDEDD